MRSKITAELLFFTHSYMTIIHETASLFNQIIETLSDPSIWANFFTAKFLSIKMSPLEVKGTRAFSVQNHCSSHEITDLGCCLLLRNDPPDR